jgi:hypothetical protein
MSATGAAVSHPAGDAALAGVLVALFWPFRELGYSRR